MDIHSIKDPSFLKKMSIKELEETASDIREFIIESLSKTGGHLASNLGVVELTMALHKVFDSPKDKFIFDVGHQSYTHKILTNRIHQFDTLRQFEGLSGFPKRKESEHDVWETGHSSTSISAASGFVFAQEYLESNEGHVIPIIGDGSLTGGMAFEALNYMGQHPLKKFILIVNDNGMSISGNVGYFSKMLSKVRMKRSYMKAKRMIPRRIRRLFPITKSALKRLLQGKNIFEDMGFTYLGPVNGHDFSDLIRFLSYAKQSNKSCVIHVKTIKGMGYHPAESDEIGSWHGTGPFEIESGNGTSKSDSTMVTWSEAISESLRILSREDKLIGVITPAMINGSKLLKYQEEFPNRLHDVGIAEQHALTMAGGMAMGGMKPFVSIYSSFLQRAYDQLNHDIARQKLNVVLGIDRAGIVGPDGDTHQGLFDISLMNPIPNMTICMPHNANMAFKLLEYGLHTHKEGPIAIRYPRGKVNIEKLQSDDYVVQYGTWDSILEGNDINIITYGPEVHVLKDFVERNNISANLIHATFIKPMDTKMLQKLLNNRLPILIIEEAMTIGGLASSIMHFAQKQDKQPKIKVIGIDDIFIEHGDTKNLKLKHGLDPMSIMYQIREMLK